MNERRERLQIRGLMNTGTNFLGALLESNKMKARDDFKHALPDLLVTPSRFLEVIMVRHPLSWVTGMQKAPYFIDCERKKSFSPNATCTLSLQLKDRPVVAHFKNIIDIWNRYYSGYLAWEHCWYIVRYEDLLLDADKTIETLTQKKRKKGPDAKKKPAKAHGHARSFAGAKAFNLKKQWKARFTTNDLKSHCDHVNKTLLSYFHYDCP